MPTRAANSIAAARPSSSTRSRKVCNEHARLPRAPASPIAPRAPAAMSCALLRPPPDVREKAPGDWVTAADVASEDSRARELDARDRPARVRRGSRAATRSKPVGSSIRSTARRTSCTASTRSACRWGSSKTVKPVVGVVHAPLLDRTFAPRARWGSVPRRAADARERAPPRRRSSRPGSRSATRTCWRVTSRCWRRRCTPSRTCAGSGPPASTCAGPPKACSTAISSCASGPGTSPRAPSSCGRPAGSSPTGRATPGLARESGNILAGPPPVHAVLLEISPHRG
jgi:hypothetical protein